MSDLFKIAENDKAVLEIFFDSDVEDPRTDFDNFGKMVCWHRHYNLGDSHKYENSKDLFSNLVRETLSPKKVIDYVKKGKADGIKLFYRATDKRWHLEVYSEHFKKWFELDESYHRDEKESLFDALLEEMSLNDLLSLAREKHIVLPLYLYDHSGLTMNTGGFSCPWDSGQVGWLYCSHADIRNEYGKLTKENLERARNLLESEVETYDQYLRGDVYGFQLISKKNGDEIDSCWGFYGDDFKKNGLNEHLSEEYENLIDELEYVA